MAQHLITTLVVRGIPAQVALFNFGDKSMASNELNSARRGLVGAMSLGMATAAEAGFRLAPSSTPNRFYRGEFSRRLISSIF
jgi:hypothetical protein